MTPERVLVTGGSGFIGSHLMEALLDAGQMVRNLDVLPPTIAKQREHWAEVDLMDQDALNDAFQSFKPSLVFNLAAVADISVGPEALRPNSEGLSNLLKAGRLLRNRPRVVHISTQLVVGPGYVPSHSRDYAPYTAYGESKAESERILWDHAEDYVWTILRPTNVWGPRHATFPNSSWKLLNRRLYMMPTGANPVRSYGYVTNVVAQMIAAGTAEDEKIDRQVFYVGDEPIPSTAWIDGFSKALTGKPCRRVPLVLLKILATCGEFGKRLGIPMPFDRGRLYRITTDYAVPMSSTFSHLGRGSVTVEEGVSLTVKWLRLALPREYRR